MINSCGVFSPSIVFFFFLIKKGWRERSIVIVLSKRDHSSINPTGNYSGGPKGENHRHSLKTKQAKTNKVIA
jgi:hypothetical protein